MVGANLLARVRRLLRDVATVTEQGEFWSDAEIYLALNNAQLSYASFLLRNSQYHYIASLLTNTSLSAGGNLPADYFMYASAYVERLFGDRYTKSIAKIYCGAEAWSYRFVKDTACWIVGNQYGFVDGANYNANGRLYYYRYPTIIVAGVFNSDFSNNQYESEISHIASIYLSMKEPQTQRDFKRLMATMKDINSQFVFEDIVHYVVNNDVSQFYQRYISNVRREAAQSGASKQE